MTDLHNKNCIPCKGGIPPFDLSEIHKYVKKGTPLNKIGYFAVELLKPIIPTYFDDKKRSISIISASTLLKILLPERQTNKKIYFYMVSFNVLNYSYNDYCRRVN